MASGVDRFPSGSGGFAQVVKKSVTDLYLTVHDFGVQVDTFVVMPKGFAVRQLQIIRLEGPRARLRLVSGSSVAGCDGGGGALSLLSPSAASGAGRVARRQKGKQ
jgi:hypothetical protein